MAKDADDLARALEAMSAGKSKEPTEPPPAPDDAEEIAASAPRQPLPQARTAAPSAAAQEAEARRKTEMKRTLIPILLTVGGMLALAGGASLVAGNDALLAVAPAAAWGMLLVGLCLLLVAVMNMMQVRDALNQQRASQNSPR